MNQFIAKSIAAAAFLGFLAFGAARAADPLAATTRLVALADAPTTTESTFDIVVSQDLIVTLTDLKVPAALSSASIVITQADQIVGQATLAPPATSATVALTAAMGHYTLRVIGAPDPNQSIGFFTGCIAPKASPANCIQSASIAGNISAASSASDSTVSTLSTDLKVTTAGSYTFTFSDFAFPAALRTAPNLALFQGSTPVALGIASGTSIALNPGTYTLLAIAQADATLKAGLYGLSIKGPAGVTPLIDDSIPVGLANPFSAPNNPAAQSLTLKVTDFAFPTALTSAVALATFGGALLGSVSTAGTAQVSFAAPATTPLAPPLKVWTYATAGSDAGTYGIDLSASSASLLSTARGVGSGSSLAYAFITPTLTAGAYRAAASDFEFPSALRGLKFAVLQNGAILKQSAVAGGLDFTAAAGPVTLLVDALTPANGNGLFGITLQTGGTSPSLLFDKAQAVSAAVLFDSQDLVLGTTGGFDISLADLKFPAQFQDLALVVSRSGTVLGKIFGGGTFSISATPGTYQLAFIATPGAQQKYGLYAAKIVSSLPTITLTAAPMTVVAGDLTQLNWTTKDADSCSASGGNWTGSKAIGSGSESIRVDASVTLKLTCLGAGGTSSKSVDIKATPKPASSGGGGALDLVSLLGLAALLPFARRGLAPTPFRPRQQSQSAQQ